MTSKDPERPTPGAETRGTPNSGLTAATLGFFFGFAAVALFGSTAKGFRELMDLGPTQVGLLVAAPALSGSLLRIPFSAWVDTTGGRKPFIVLLATSIVGMTGLVVIISTLYPDRLTSELYPVILLLGVLSGAGIATFSVGISQVAYWFPQSRQGWALGTYAGAGNLAPGMFSFLLPVVLAWWGLQTAYVLWLALLVVGLTLYWVLGQNAPYFQLRRTGLPPEEARTRAGAAGQELFPASSVMGTLRVSARNWKTWALVVLYFTTFGGFIALTAWLPTYWQELHGVSLFLAGTFTALFSILASAIRIPGGSVSDRFGGERTAMVALALLLVGALGMTLSNNLSVALGASVLMALGMGVNNAAVFKLAPQEVPEAVGGAAGWIGGLGAFGGFAIPPVMGVFVRSGGLSGYATGFGVFVALSALSMAVVWLLQRASHARALGAGVRGSAAALLAIAALASASGADVARAESGLTGAELYEEHCELCHEADGAGDPGEVPPLARNPEIADTAYVERVIRGGISGPLERLGETYDDEMEGFPELSDDEVAAIANYVQGGFGTATASAHEPTIPGDGTRGERIFAGQDDLSNGGPSCFSCHTAGVRGHLGGSGLGPDLTDLRERFKGDLKLAGALRKPPSPVMRQVYAGRALSDEEVADLRVFFAEIEPSKPASTDWLIVLGLACTGALLVLHGILFAFIPKVSYSRKLRKSK